MLLHPYFALVQIVNTSLNYRVSLTEDNYPAPALLQVHFYPTFSEQTQGRQEDSFSQLQESFLTPFEKAFLRFILILHSRRNPGFRYCGT